MDKFVKGVPGQREAEDEATPNTTTTKTNTRKHVVVTTIQSKEPRGLMFEGEIKY